jgi:hypothetical protein
MDMVGSDSLVGNFESAFNLGRNRQKENRKMSAHKLNILFIFTLLGGY